VGVAQLIAQMQLGMAIVLMPKAVTSANVNDLGGKRRLERIWLLTREQERDLAKKDLETGMLKSKMIGDSHQR